MKKLLLLLGIFALSFSAAAQYPNKPVRAIVAFGVGGATDVIARIVAASMSQSLGQPVVVENKPGADGAISAVEVAKSPADGHTLFIATNSPLSAAPHLRKKLPYDPLADFTPIGFVGNYTFFAVVHPSVPARTLGELVKHAQANPGKVHDVSTAAFESGQSRSLRSVNLTEGFESFNLGPIDGQAGWTTFAANANAPQISAATPASAARE